MFIAMAFYLVLVITFIVINWWDALSTNHELEEVRKIAYSDKMMKKTNYIFGHIAGDELLIGSAECIIKAFGAYGSYGCYASCIWYF